MYSLLTTILPADAILRNELMANHTTFQIGGPADYFLIPQTIEQLSQLLQLAKENNIPWMVIGNGSNLLVKDGGIRGWVITTSALKAYSINGTQIIAQAGITLEELAQIAQQHQLTGLEFSCGIPGSLGGAVVMNAGAYDGEMQNVISSSSYLDLSGHAHTLDAIEHQFSYRHSIYQHLQAIITEATIQLQIGDGEQIQQKMDNLQNQRWSKQPMDMPSGGSVFKRPEGYFVGKLVDDCGLRGYRIGGAEVSDKHCGFIINQDHATAKDVLQLIRHVQKTVFECFGVKLEPELRIIGED